MLRYIVIHLYVHWHGDLLWCVLFMHALIHYRKIKCFIFLFSQHAFFQNDFFPLFNVGYQYTNIYAVHREKILKFKLPNTCDTWDIQVRIWSYLSCSCITDISRTGEEVASRFDHGVQLFRSLWTSCF